jgi:hypothetical protein
MLVGREGMMTPAGLILAARQELVKLPAVSPLSVEVTKVLLGLRRSRFQLQQVAAFLLIT